MAKDKISQDEYLQLVGLFALAKEHNRSLRDIEKTVAQTTGIEDETGGGYYGYIIDAIYEVVANESIAVNDVLKKLNIEISNNGEK